MTNAIKYTNGTDDLYIVKCKTGFYTATCMEKHSYIADGVKYTEDACFMPTGFDFKTLKEAKAHVASFGFKAA